MGSPRYVIEKTENTERVMTSCMVLSCAALNSYEPSRLAGTWKQYSKNAMPQLMMITFHRATLRNFKCPYQANVMNMFEMVRRRIVRKFFSCVNQQDVMLGDGRVVSIYCIMECALARFPGYESCSPQHGSKPA